MLQVCLLHVLKHQVMGGNHTPENSYGGGYADLSLNKQIYLPENLLQCYRK